MIVKPFIADAHADYFKYVEALLRNEKATLPPTKAD